jgi:two-component system sensor histidine kinase/response regulator
MINKDNQPKILIVDDDPVSGTILEGYLQPDNYCIHHVVNGEKALQRVRNINTLKNDKATQDVPVLFTTALSDPDSHKKGIESGGEGFIVKPFNEGLIRAYVKIFLKMKKTFDNARQKLDFDKDFTSMTIHDLKNLNMVISGNLEMAVMEFDESTIIAKNYVGKALSALGSANEILKKAQDITILKSTWNCMEFTLINLIDLIKKASSLFETEMELKNLRSDLQGSDPVEVCGERNLLLRVLVNLIGNAVKFSWPGTKINLAVRKKKEGAGDSGQLVEVAISNRCRPIPKEYNESIFERFKQVPDEQKRKRGQGLGLAFCKIVIELHGGTIWVESPMPGGESGVAVHFTLPRVSVE